MMVAGGDQAIFQSAGQKCLHGRFHIARSAGNYPEPRFGQHLFGGIANAAADDDLNAVFC